MVMLRMGTSLECAWHVISYHLRKDEPEIGYRMEDLVLEEKSLMRMDGEALTVL
jgi:hypothetical protein